MEKPKVDPPFSVEIHTVIAAMILNARIAAWTKNKKIIVKPQIPCVIKKRATYKSTSKRGLWPTSGTQPESHDWCPDRSKADMVSGTKKALAESSWTQLHSAGSLLALVYPVQPRDDSIPPVVARSHSGQDSARSLACRLVVRHLAHSPLVGFLLELWPLVFVDWRMDCNRQESVVWLGLVVPFEQMDPLVKYTIFSLNDLYKEVNLY